MTLLRLRTRLFLRQYNWPLLATSFFWALILYEVIQWRGIFAWLAP